MIALHLFLRSALRRAWLRYPERTAFILENRFRAHIGIAGREVWAGKCNACKAVKATKLLDIDHIEAIGATPGSRNATASVSWDTFIARLFASRTAYQFLCKKCHKIKTKKEKAALSR